MKKFLKKWSQKTILLVFKGKFIQAMRDNGFIIPQKGMTNAQLHRFFFKEYEFKEYE